jgi:hypothetical protein
LFRKAEEAVESVNNLLALEIATVPGGYAKPPAFRISLFLSLSFSTHIDAESPHCLGDLSVHSQKTRGYRVSISNMAQHRGEAQGGKSIMLDGATEAYAMS